MEIALESAEKNREDENYQLISEAFAEAKKKSPESAAVALASIELQKMLHHRTIHNANLIKVIRLLLPMCEKSRAELIGFLKNNKDLQ